MTIDNELKQLRYALVAALKRIDTLTEHIQNMHPLDAPPMADEGSRIPADFRPLPQHVEWARQQYPEVDAADETHKFINYWHGVHTKKGIKKDWQRAWRNWISRCSSRPSRPKPQGQSFAERVNGLADEVDRSDLRKAGSQVRTEVDQPVEERQRPAVRNEGVERGPVGLAARGYKAGL